MISILWCVTRPYFVWEVTWNLCCHGRRYLYFVTSNFWCAGLSLAICSTYVLPKKHVILWTKILHTHTHTHTSLSAAVYFVVIKKRQWSCLAYRNVPEYSNKIEWSVKYRRDNCISTVKIMNVRVTSFRLWGNSYDERKNVSLYCIIIWIQFQLASSCREKLLKENFFRNPS
jgi:hypothetical protein